MYQVLMFDGGVYRINELYELIEDIGGLRHPEDPASRSR